MSKWTVETVGVIKHAFNKDSIIGLKSAIRSHCVVDDVEIFMLDAGEFQIDVKSRHDVIPQRHLNEISYLIKGYLYHADPAIIFIQE